MKKILCPTDFSNRSLSAYNFASQVALALPADLVLYHASTTPVGESDALYFKDPKDFPANIQLENKKILKTWQQLKNSESFSGKRSKFDFVIEQGFPLASIIRAVSKYNADLVIMHTKAEEREKFEGVYIGSIGAQVVEEVKVPVLLVPPGVIHEHIKRAVYAVDLEDYDLVSVKKAIAFVRSFGAHLTFLNFGNAKADLVEDFKKKVFYEMESKHVDLVVREAKDFVTGLNEFISENEIDMLVMERHRKNILEKLFAKSFVKEMEVHAHIPLLILHVKD